MYWVSINWKSKLREPASRYAAQTLTNSLETPLTLSVRILTYSTCAGDTSAHFVSLSAAVSVTDTWCHWLSLRPDREDSSEVAPRSTLTHVWYRETERGAGWKWGWVGDNMIGRMCDLTDQRGWHRMIVRSKSYSEGQAKPWDWWNWFCLTKKLEFN